MHIKKYEVQELPTKGFVESGVVVTFDAEWEAIRYDDHRYFKALSGSGFSGVDFIAVYREHLYLIELKNYSYQHPEQSQLPEEDIPELIGRLQDKATDTLKGLDIVKKSLMRRTRFRMLWKHPQLAVFYREWRIWKKIIQLQEAKLVTFVLVYVDDDKERIASLMRLINEKWTRSTPPQLLINPLGKCI